MTMQQVLLPLQPRVSVWLLAVCKTAHHQELLSIAAADRCR